MVWHYETLLYLATENRILIVLVLSIFWQDWIDIDFGIRESVDFIAVSFVKAADVIMHLKSYVSARSPKR